jgi:hypothetical protein
MAYQSSSNCYSVDVSYCRNFHTSVFTRFFVAFTETRFHDKSVPKFLTVRILIIIIRKTHIVRPMLCSWLRGRFLRTFKACFCIIESNFVLVAWFAKFAKIFLLGWLCPIRSDTLTLNLYPGRIPSVDCSYFMRLDAKLAFLSCLVFVSTETELFQADSCRFPRLKICGYLLTPSSDKLER